MRRLFIFILFVLPSFLYAEHDWASIKLGYGNETAGIGLAAEAKLSRFGLVLGVGIPDSRLGVSATSKYYLSVTEEQTIFVSAGYGMLGFMINNLGLDVFETAYIYGPYFMFGMSNIWGDIIGDYSLGFGYSFVDSNLVLTAQASLGFILNLF